MNVLHPAAKMLVKCSASQDVEAGDGTTSVVVLAGALLDVCTGLLAKGIHPAAIASSFHNAAEASKVASQDSDLLTPLAIDSVLGILGPDPGGGATNVDLRDIGMVLGGTVDDTELVRGLVFDKGSTKTAGGPGTIENARIALIHVVVSDYAAMDREKIKKCGANVVLIQKSILRNAYNELGLHFLAKMGILVVTDVKRTDKLGSADHVGDVVLPGSGHKVIKFVGVANPGRTMTVLLRGSNDLVLAEANRSIHNAQCVVRSLVKERFLAPLRLRELSMETTGMDSHCFHAYADALEVIPYTLAENAGLKPIEIVTELRKAHAEGNVGAGIDVKDGCISDMYAKNVIQQLLVKTSMIKLATETVCMILKEGL
ncbi:hypothetical protein ACHAW5_006674 [Stephanodiscus triporus]|uniref:T-complex protein 1 subunit delta n=1 Tax=Stephanodiscus triporus TaxID=2934178 RepID=A0ABD3MDU2_9STRA